MATSPTKPFRMAPLQRLTVKAIADPAKQAALDEWLKQREANSSNDSATRSSDPASTDVVSTSSS